MTNYSIRYRSYARPFRRSLTTAHGVWSVREGVLIELRSLGGKPDFQTRDNFNDVHRNSVGLGEVAPLPWFGSETLAEALDFCRSLAGQIDDEGIETIPDRLPACQFAFESARRLVWSVSAPTRSFPAIPMPPPSRSSLVSSLEISRLLPAGRASLDALDRESNDPTYRTYKWKIATESIDDELAIFQALRQRLPPRTRLRLDANGGLSYDDACRWLESCDRLNGLDESVNPADHILGFVEFLEQPLPPTQWSHLLRLSQQFATPIALDESIANLQQLDAAQTQGWSGIYVIKPAIIGSPQRLRSLCTAHQLDTVFSSVFETAIGQDAGVQLAQELQTRKRAIGYGLDDWLC